MKNNFSQGDNLSFYLKENERPHRCTVFGLHEKRQWGVFCGKLHDC